MKRFILKLRSVDFLFWPATHTLLDAAEMRHIRGWQGQDNNTHCKFSQRVFVHFNESNVSEKNSRVESFLCPAPWFLQDPLFF